MRKRDRISILVIGCSLICLSPVNICNMLWDGTINHALQALYFGVFSWGLVAIAACVILYAILADGD